ncbi:hypothetical protein NDU88_003043 [Pleurodeles waltl]|uniref:Uncharacterized protein n=1 Tax=Pleurodeles waltl TaxID=8319 RepID=A0AAV7MPP3_PLEWA|nr:hypothetical protein NDU88_003043 [Pleurodeles waltl]
MARRRSAGVPSGEAGQPLRLVAEWRVLRCGGAYLPLTSLDTLTYLLCWESSVNARKSKPLHNDCQKKKDDIAITAIMGKADNKQAKLHFDARKQPGPP